MSTKTSILARNVEVFQLALLADGGLLCIFDGARPADADTAITDQLKLSTLLLGSPAFGDPVEGVITANPLTQDSSIAHSGVASWYRVYESDGVDALWDGSVGLIDSGEDLELNSVHLQAGAICQVTAFEYELPP